MTIGTVIFDLAGVVCRFDRERRVTALSSACGVPHDLVEERLYGSGLVDAADSGLAAVHIGPAGGLDAVQRLTRDLHAHGLLSRPMPGATP